MVEPLVLSTTGVGKWANLSPDGLCRYKLGREWGAGPPLVCIGCNPSTADAHDDDPTLRFWMELARRWGFGSVLVGNACALRSSDPAALLKHQNPLGPGNAEGALRELVKESYAGKLLLCWGDSCPVQFAASALALVDAGAGVPYALGLTQAGNPVHPLGLARRLKGDERLRIQPHLFYELRASHGTSTKA